MLSENTIKKGLRYCCEDISKIEGYNEAITSDKRYCCHHKLGIDVSKEELIEKGLYYNRPASELIWMEIGAHVRLHYQNRREETIKKISDAKKGEKNPMYGKHHTDEARTKMSAARIGENNPMYGIHKYGADNPMYGKHHSEESKQKISDAKKGTRLSDETKQKLSDATKGEKNGRAKQCTINGTTYGCLKDAHKALYLNISWSTFYKKYKKGEF